jgi:D-alanyl-D-alanine carboxypeptidase (penicillin-binding protein 5/6)
MNRVAKELGLRNTQFRNPHGLSARGHHSSARDLAQLARAAGQHALFREVTSTRRRGALLTHTSGYQRPVVWENTNQLLKQSGFVGVKTGTTGPAGACLVSRGVRNGHELIVVVLGSTSPDGRYVDSRNLYRFAWSELEKQQKK